MSRHLGPPSPPARPRSAPPVVASGSQPALVTPPLHTSRPATPSRPQSPDPTIIRPELTTKQSGSSLTLRSAKPDAVQGDGPPATGSVFLSLPSPDPSNVQRPASPSASNYRLAAAVALAKHPDMTLFSNLFFPSQGQDAISNPPSRPRSPQAQPEAALLKESEGDDSLSETKLRKLFEDEEIERFLHVFTSHVHGVTLAPSVIPATSLPKDGSVPTSSTSSTTTIELPPDISAINAYLLRKLIPLLPKEPVPFSQDPSETFSLSKLQANATRLYIFFPTYSQLVAKLWRVACWKDWNRSARLCAGYWVLWYFDLLLPLLFFGLLYEIVRRRYLPYPSLKELRERRASTREAETFGQAAGLNYWGSLGITEMLGFKTAWRAWRDSKTTRKVVQKLDDREGMAIAGVHMDSEDDHVYATIAGAFPLDSPARAAEEAGVQSDVQSPTASVDTFDTSSARSELAKLLEQERKLAAGKEAQQEEKRRNDEAKTKREAVKVEESRRKAEEREKRREEDWRKGIMIAVGEMADLHERVRNMFLWRNPAASRVYSFVFAGLGFFTLLAPPRYFLKAVYALIGFAYFFLIPFLRAMPSKYRSRMPPAFSDVPTDAQYAYSLVKERAQRGESIVPAGLAMRRDLPTGSTPAMSAVTGDDADEIQIKAQAAGLEDSKDAPKKSEWEKFIATSKQGWVLAEEGKRMLAGEPSLASIKAGENVASFPAQSASGLGTLHISSAHLWFTPLTISEDTSTRVALLDIGGVKKTGMLGLGGGKWGGLEIKLKTGEILRFPFVGSRNEAFAQLLAHSDQSWLRM